VSEPEQSDEPGEDAFGREVRRKEDRKVRARRDRDRSVWFFLGMMGLVGWSVAVPTLIGVALGAWADRYATGRISWTLTGLVVGATIGCITAWFWVRRESGGRDDED